MLFAATALNYADRAILSVAAPTLQADLGLARVMMGYVFSAFSWAYVLGQLPGGRLLDLLGSKQVYAAGILLWSVFTALQGGITAFGANV